MHALDLFELAQSFIFSGFWHLRRLDLFAKLLHFFSQFVSFAEFSLNGLHLLPQIEFALRSIDVGARLGIDFLLDRQDFNFLVQNVVNATQTRRRIGNFQY